MFLWYGEERVFLNEDYRSKIISTTIFQGRPHRSHHLLEHTLCSFVSSYAPLICFLFCFPLMLLLNESLSCFRITSIRAPINNNNNNNK